MNTIKEQINMENLPSHVAIIMDGNGRWAKKQGKLRLFGHNNGVSSVRAVTEAAAELGIKFLTLYAFSTENWNRPEEEVKGSNYGRKGSGYSCERYRQCGIAIGKSRKEIRNITTGTRCYQNHTKCNHGSNHGIQYQGYGKGQSGQCQPL